jgi:5-hydroxyisourate hydrolase
MDSTLSTHVLDTARGKPGAMIPVALFALDGERRELARAVTNPEGRTDAPLSTSVAPGYYELVFEVGDYFAGQGMPTFFYEIPVRFHVRESGVHYHVPLLLSPWGYSTYRGS